MEYVTLVAAEPVAYQALWEEARLEGPLPDVDLEREIVVLFGPAVTAAARRSVSTTWSSTSRTAERAE